MIFQAHIIAGRGEGKRIGFPTLNFEVPEGLREKFGIYAGWVFVDEKKLPAVFHWGPIPTFGIEKYSLEAYLLNGMLSARPSEAGFELAEFLRPVETFANAALLAEQIQKDADEARRILD